MIDAITCDFGAIARNLIAMLPDTSGLAPLPVPQWHAMPHGCRLPLSKPNPESVVRFKTAMGASDAFQPPSADVLHAYAAASAGRVFTTHEEAAVYTKSAMSGTVLLNETYEAVATAVRSAGTGMQHDSEIIIRLKDDVLDGSWIKLSVKGSDISVQFVPATEQAAETALRLGGQLAERLAAKFPSFQFSFSVSSISYRRVKSDEAE